MATIVLSAVGAYFGGPLGAQVGAFVGSQIDGALFGSTIRQEGPRISDLSVQASSYGNPIPRVWGPENRISGNVIWSTGLKETKTTTTQSAGGKGGGAKTKTTTYTYSVDCGIALCRGPIKSVKRIWADGKLFRDEAGVQTQADAVRVYLGTEAQNPDPTMEAALGSGNCPAHRGLAYVFFDGLELGDFGNRIPNFTFEVEAHADATVSTVIDELCAEANVPFLDAARTDYLDLRGYSVARPATIRDILQPLRSAFFFDGAEVEGELCFFPADETPVARIGRDDLGAHEFGTDRPPPYEARRAATIELPRQITVQHLDPARDYQSNSQRARRSTTPSDSDVSVDLPMVLDADTAKGIAERMVSMAWIGRDGFTYQLPVDYLHVEAGHKIVVPHDDGKDRTLRVARRDLRLPGSLLVECKTDGAAVLSRAASAAPATVPTQEVTLPGVTTAHLLDLPILRDVDDASGFYVAAAGASSGWRGAVLYRSQDGGTNYAAFLDLTASATIGETADALGTASPNYWDEANTVTVELLNPADTLASVTKAEVLNGANAAAIGDEVIQFRTATLSGPQTYVLSGLLRGRQGTEDKIAGHSAGDRFVLLTGAVGIFRPVVEAAETGVARQFKAVSVGTELSSTTSQSFTHTGRWAKPYAPAHVRGSRDGAGDLTVTWIRRTRLAAPWADGVDAPLGEASEAYEVDIMDGATVVRTIAAASETLTYTAAEQTTDFGSPQSSIVVQVYQKSAAVGRGLPSEATL